MNTIAFQRLITYWYQIKKSNKNSNDYKPQYTHIKCLFFNI